MYNVINIRSGKPLSVINIRSGKPFARTVIMSKPVNVLYRRFHLASIDGRTTQRLQLYCAAIPFARTDITSKPVNVVYRRFHLTSIDGSTTQRLQLYCAAIPFARTGIISKPWRYSTTPAAILCHYTLCAYRHNEQACQCVVSPFSSRVNRWQNSTTPAAIGSRYCAAIPFCAYRHNEQAGQCDCGISFRSGNTTIV